MKARRVGSHSARHEHVKITVINIIKKYGSKTNIATDINMEPVLKDSTHTISKGALMALGPPLEPRQPHLQLVKCVKC